jgi:hypothetical protein
MKAIDREEEEPGLLYRAAYKAVVRYKEKLFCAYYMLGAFDTADAYLAFQKKEEMDKLFIIYFEQLILAERVRPEPGGLANG